jgi:hypothetical protein
VDGRFDNDLFVDESIYLTIIIINRSTFRKENNEHRAEYGKNVKFL